MTPEQIISNLDTKGYVVIPNVLSEDEVRHSLDLFHNWKDSIPNLEKMHNKVDPHGIFKFHQAGHQPHAWNIRTTPKIIDIYKTIWNTDELSVSFDGCCWIPKNLKKKDNIWTHTDQAPNSKGLKCYQGFVALTSNKERTLVVYKGSHKLHEKYFEDRGIKSSKNWQLIEHDYLKSIEDKRRCLNVPAGSLVLWDSRVFHQNRYGKPMSEERIVQYVCYLPKNNKGNTESQKKKKLKYLNELRTTSHWPYPIRVNSLQPPTYGDKSILIDYNSLPKPDLENMMEDIMKLI